MMFIHGKAEIRLKTRFDCHGCGRVQAGDTVKLDEIEFWGPVYISEALRKFRASPSAMPVGWRSVGGDKSNGWAARFLCPSCKEKADSEPLAVTRRLVEGESP